MKHSCLVVTFTLIVASAGHCAASAVKLMCDDPVPVDTHIQEGQLVQYPQHMGQRLGSGKMKDNGNMYPMTTFAVGFLATAALLQSKPRAAVFVSA